MKKRILSLVITLGIVLGLGITSYAATREYHESESNGSISNADRFYAREDQDRVVIGDLHRSSDKDYFKIYAHVTGTMKLRFYYEGYQEIDLLFYDANGDEIGRERDVNSSFSESFQVQEDDYIYVCVDHTGGDLNEEYRLYFYMK